MFTKTRWWRWYKWETCWLQSLHCRSSYFLKEKTKFGSKWNFLKNYSVQSSKCPTTQGPSKCVYRSSQSGFDSGQNLKGEWAGEWGWTCRGNGRGSITTWWTRWQIPHSAIYWRSLSKSELTHPPCFYLFTSRFPRAWQKKVWCCRAATKTRLTKEIAPDLPKFRQCVFRQSLKRWLWTRSIPSPFPNNWELTSHWAYFLSKKMMKNAVARIHLNQEFNFFRKLCN